MKFRAILQEAGVPLASQSAGGMEAHTPIDGSPLNWVAIDDASAIEAKIQAATRAFRDWRAVPAPTRGELVRRFAERKSEKLVIVEPGQASLVEMATRLTTALNAAGSSFPTFTLVTKPRAPTRRASSTTSEEDS